MKNLSTSRSGLGAESLPVPAGTKSGDPVRVGVLNGVAATNIGEGGNPPGSASVQTRGEFKLPVFGVIENVGDPVFIEDGALNVTASNPVFGYALETKPDEDLSVISIRVSNG